MSRFKHPGSSCSERDGSAQRSLRQHAAKSPGRQQKNSVITRCINVEPARDNARLGRIQSSSRSGGIESSVSAWHVLHLYRRRLCSQMPPPPHSLHELCSHCPDFSPRARFTPPLPPPSSPLGAGRLPLPLPLCSSASLLLPEPPEHPEQRPPRLPPPLPCPRLLPMRALAEPLSARPLPLLL